jgi:amidase
MSMASNMMTATEIAKAVRSGSLTAEAVMADHLSRIAARDGVVNAFLDFDAERALMLARKADKTPEKGVLHGVPFAVKDIIDTVDLPTAWGSSIYTGFQPPRNASCVEMLVGAGAIPIGKTVTTEFAYFSPGATRNPHNLDHTPGGSSSGSAAAVADGMAALGLGSQTAASLIRPAAYCGIFGYKATQGSIDLQGVMGLATSLDSFGFMARSIDDLILTRAVLCAAALPAEVARPVGPLRIAFARGPHWQEASQSTRDACATAAQTLANDGVVIDELDCPSEFQQLSEHHKTVMAFETARARRFEFTHHRDQISTAFADLLNMGMSISRDAYERALEARNGASQSLAQTLSSYDAVLTPAAPSGAPHGITATGDPLFSRLWTLLQVPTITLPFGRDEVNMPLAFQLVGGLGDDQALMAVAREVADRLGVVPKIPTV